MHATELIEVLALISTYQLARASSWSVISVFWVSGFSALLLLVALAFLLLCRGYERELVRKPIEENGARDLLSSSSGLAILILETLVIGRWH